MDWLEKFKISDYFSTLMLVGANGLTTVAEENVTSSLASLISACAPILVFLGSLAVGITEVQFSGNDRNSDLFFWDYLHFLGRIKRSGQSKLQEWYFLMFCAISGWASGTIFTKKMNIQSGNISLNLFYQFAFAGGIVQIILAFIFSDNYNFGNWTLKVYRL